MNFSTDLGLLGLLLGLHVVFSNLVSIHARSRHLDRSLPIEIVIAKVKSELFKNLFSHRGVIVSYVEVGGSDTSLCGVLRDEVEIVLGVVFRVLNNVLINQGSRRRVDHFALVVLGEKALVDPFVDNDDSDVRLGCLLVVHVSNSFIKLANLFLKHSSSLRVSNTVSEKNDVLRQLSIVVRISLKSILEGLRKSLHNFLAFLL